MAEGCCDNPTRRRTDWAGNWLAFALLWCGPSAAMIGAIWLGPTYRAVVWTLMLVTMGGACLANARRCGRIHCRLTGPFLLLMAGAVIAYGAGILPLGQHGWLLLGLMIFLGFAGLWWGSERLYGKYRQEPLE